MILGAPFRFHIFDASIPDEADEHHSQSHLLHEGNRAVDREGSSNTDTRKQIAGSLCQNRQFHIRSVVIKRVPN